MGFEDRFLQEFNAAASSRAMRLLEDNYRIGRHNFIDVAVKPIGADWFALPTVKNARVDAGALFIANIIGNSGAASPTNYLALSTSSLTPVKADTTLAGEIVTAAGLQRAITAFVNYIAPTVINGAASFQLTKTFTYTGAVQVNVISGALFNAATAGTMLSEGNFSPAQATVNANGDQIAVTWTITI